MINFPLFSPQRLNHLHILLRLLRFPRVVLLNNGIRKPGEEVFLRGLYEIRSGNNQYDAAVKVFGRNQSAQSRAYSWFIKHLQWWRCNGFMEESRQEIWNKMTEVTYYTVYIISLITYNLLGVTAFIDNNCLEMAITGAGPLAPRPEAPRYGDETQRSMYNGWKSQHGVKDQTVDGTFLDRCQFDKIIYIFFAKAKFLTVGRIQFRIMILKMFLQ